MPTVAATKLVDFTTRLFEAAGLPRGEAEMVARGLVESNLRGHDSHGVMRIPQYLGFLQRGEYRAGVALIVERESPAVVVCDAQWGFGQVQAHRLLDLVVPKARELGLAAGVARQCGHIGRLGEYAERLADEGLILIATVNNDGAAQRVAPPGGTEPRLSTNPLCAGIPAGNEPIVLDFGTSAVAEGKVRVHYLDGKTPVPEGWLVDHEGRATRDPSVLYESPFGSILPMGGGQAYKGFGLGVILDLLAGGLSGGRVCSPDAPMARGNNVVFLVIDPEQFAGRAHLVDGAVRLADHIRSCPRREGADAIRLPGDPERAVLQERTRSGIPIPDAHWSMLASHAEGLGVPIAAGSDRVDSGDGSG